MDILTIVASLVSILAWPTAILVIIMVFSHPGRVRRREIRKGNAQAAAFLKQVRSH
jgi:hypothetical protein